MPDDAAGWLFVAPEAVPARWRERARPASLVALLPDEVDQILAGGPAVPQLSGEARRLVRLVAAGRPVGTIARELDVSQRTVERRLADLRDRLGVDTTDELIALLAERGLG